MNEADNRHRRVRARVANGHAAAAPPSSVMNSRRPMWMVLTRWFGIGGTEFMEYPAITPP
jgi:hypothetical protein